MNSSQGARTRARSPRVVRLALAQVNPVVGDLPGNAKKVITFIERARSQGAELVAFPELVLTGYPPEDLLLRPEFIEQNQAALDEVVRATHGITAIIGFAQRAGDVFNAAAIAHDGAIAAVYQKSHLPNYGVFDEVRYFRPGRDPFLCVRGPLRFAVNICEDIWTPSGPTALSVYGESDLVINLSASPFHAGKGTSRDRMLATRAMDGVAYVAFVNMVGGQDELVFDGNSRIFGPKGEEIARAEAFTEDLLIVDLDLDQSFRARLKDPRSREAAQTDDGDTTLRVVALADVASPEKPALAARAPRSLQGSEEVYGALVLGTHDYVTKNGFRHVVLGLSGGIDSALTASIAVDALGPDHVTGVFLPSPFTSPESAEDAEALARHLGIEYLALPIGAEMESYRKTLSPIFAGREEDTTEENLQSRIRGNILMALSNKFGWIVLTTGNKSEYSCGYATLYGDMAGGFAVLKDVFKTLVYDLARYRNARAAGPWIPERTVTREPTAELKPDQRDTDSLPPYDVLDPILQAYVEEDWEIDRIVERGYEPALVRRVVAMVDRAEYKRRQAPPGIRITARGLGKDRRLPITSGHQPWRD